MKHLLSASFALTVAACSAPNTDLPTDETVGSFRDAHDCIPSAGYEWSKSRKECIRLWEEGTELVHQGSGDPAFSAYALLSDKQAEIFLPEEDDGILLQRDTSVPENSRWVNETADYVLMRDPIDALIITDRAGFVMFREETAQEVDVEFVEHSADTHGGNIMSEHGLVTRVEDGAYPMFTIHIRLDGHDNEMAFSLIAEGATIVGATIDQLENKPVNIEYVDVESWELMFIRPMLLSLTDPNSLNDEERGDLWRVVSGRLTGASEVSGGDLPDTVTIETNSGETVEFDHFIDSDLVQLNNQDVSAWLAPRVYKDLRRVAVQE